MTQQSGENLSSLLEAQMRSIPVRAEGARVSGAGGGKTRLAIPLQRRRLGRLLPRLFRISSERNLELDALGSEIYNLCDGKRTIEQIIAIHQQNWMLSFFEARAMILQFLKTLSRRNLVFFLAPSGEAERKEDEEK